jgi:hypothetical protein
MYASNGEEVRRESESLWRYHVEVGEDVSGQVLSRAAPSPGEAQR